MRLSTLVLGEFGLDDLESDVRDYYGLNGTDPRDQGGRDRAVQLPDRVAHVSFSIR